MHQLEVELKKNELGSIGVLKIISGNAAKPLKIRQETWITRASKTAKVVIKRIVI